MIEFRRNEKTGVLEAWKDGKYVGDIDTMGDHVLEQKSSRNDGENIHG